MPTVMTELLSGAHTVWPGMVPGCMARLLTSWVCTSSTYSLVTTGEVGTLKHYYLPSSHGTVDFIL